MSKNIVEKLKALFALRSQKTYRDKWAQYGRDAIKRGYLVRKIISKFISVDGIKVLDVGCGSTGGISIAFSNKGTSEVYSFDIDPERVERSKAKAKQEKANIAFLIASGLNLPFKACSFDVVICNDVIEHVPKPEQLVKDAYYSLKNSGFLYVSAPNGIAPYRIIHDPHYNLFGLSLMSYRFGKYYATKIWKINEDYDVYGPFNYWGLKGLLTSLFNITECYHEYYSYIGGGFLKSLVQSLPDLILRFVAPQLIIICKKTSSKELFG
jgi:2-polyprenyl-3-methyl-5-hydroxy-6-metoxy-1,4-benzoquinol methylase